MSCGRWVFQGPVSVSSSFILPTETISIVFLFLLPYYFSPT